VGCARTFGYRTKIDFFRNFGASDCISTLRNKAMHKARISEVSQKRAASKQAATLAMSSTSTHPQGQRVPHAFQDDFLRIALWYLMGGAAAESIMAAQEQRPAA